MADVQLADEDLVGPAAEIWPNLTIDERHVFRVAFAHIFANTHMIGDFIEGSVTFPGRGICQAFYIRVGYAHFILLSRGKGVLVYRMWLSREAYDADEAAGTFSC